MSNFLIRLRKESGATVLMAATIIVPLLFLLFSLSLDASRYMAENQQTQKLLDEIALYAYRFLPFEEEARQAALSYVSRYKRLASATSIDVDADTVSLLYNGLSPLSFARFFGLQAEIPITAYSRARGTPFDTLVLLDVSSYCGPDVSALSAWGDVTDWPAASFFSNEFRLTESGTEIDARIVTQQCFSPALVAMKQAAVSTFEYLSHFRYNAVGLGVYPGTASPVELLRDVVSQQQRPAGPGESDFNLYHGQHNRNELCAAAAEREQTQSKYQFPAPNVRLESGVVPPGQPVTLALPDPSEGTWQMNFDFIPYLRARHSLWSQVRRENLIGDTAEVLREVRARLMGATFKGQRGGLSNAVHKSAFIFAGDVPHSAGQRFPAAAVMQSLTTQIEGLKSDIADSTDNIYVKLYYVVFRHEGNDHEMFESAIGELFNFLNEQQKIGGEETERLQLALVYADSADDLSRVASGPLVMSRRTALLSR